MSAHRKLLEEYVELYNSGDLDACMDLYAEDAVQGMPDGSFEGRSAIHERLAREPEGFPDATYIVDSFVEQGDTFADEWTFVGHTRVRTNCRTARSYLPPASGSRSRAWSWSGARREDRRRQPVLRQHGRRGPAGLRPGRRDRLTELVG